MLFRSADPPACMKDRKRYYRIVQIRPSRKFPDPDIQIHKQKGTEKSTVKDHSGSCVIQAVEKFSHIMDIWNIIPDKIRKANDKEQEMTANKHPRNSAEPQIENVADRKLCSSLKKQSNSQA